MAKVESGKTAVQKSLGWKSSNEDSDKYDGCCCSGTEDKTRSVPSLVGKLQTGDRFY